MLARLIESTTVLAAVDADGADAALDMNYISTLSVQSVIDETSITGGAIAYQKSNVTIDGAASTDDADWTDIDTETAITTDTTEWFTIVGPTFRWFRVRFEVASGEMDMTIYYLARGEDKK